jgi:hypothetical protein
MKDYKLNPTPGRQKSMIYEIRVNQTKYDEYPCFSFYNITSNCEHEAKKEAQELFQHDTGFKPIDSKATIITKKQ